MEKKKFTLPARSTRLGNDGPGYNDDGNELASRHVLRVQCIDPLCEK